MMRNKIKTIPLLAFLLIFAVSGICSAAKSSSRPASRPSTNVTKSVPATGSTTNSGYKPSAPANSYTNKAPDAKSATSQTMPPNSGSSWMRNAGLFGGGMMMGSLLSSMLGYGGYGMMANIMGALFSFLPIILIFMLGRVLWNRYKSNQKKDYQKIIIGENELEDTAPYGS